MKFEQVGGKLSSLEKHIAAVKSNVLFEGTDFKLATCDHPVDDKVAKECGFTSLSIRIVQVNCLWFHLRDSLSTDTDTDTDTIYDNDN